MKNKGNMRMILVSVFCMIMLFMGVGYASFQENLNESGTVKNGSRWNIHYEDVTVMAPEGSSAVNHKITFDASKKIAILDMSLMQPSDEIVYTFTITNEGNVDAIIDSIEIVEASNDEAKTYVSPITYTTSGLTNGSNVPAGTTAAFTVTAKYNQVDTVVNEERKNISVIVHYRQREK